MGYNPLPSKDEAERILEDALKQNPGKWGDHSRVAARAAETIAWKCGLDADRAYVSGLLHDIGRYEGVRGLHHIIAGYYLMKEKGYDQIAEICLSHSFPYQDLRAFGGGNIDCDEHELKTITAFLSDHIYNDYDRLLQLCDSMGSAEGVCLIDVRLLDVARRYGSDDFTLKKWESILALKKYFDGLCGMNVYDLFYDEIRDVSFR